MEGGGYGFDGAFGEVDVFDCGCLFDAAGDGVDGFAEGEVEELVFDIDAGREGDEVRGDVVTAEAWAGFDDEDAAGVDFELGVGGLKIV